ncbi:MAG: hypothetical protein JNL55_15710, partial [Steroidobacter sp.]
MIRFGQLEPFTTGRLHVDQDLHDAFGDPSERMVDPGGRARNERDMDVTAGHEGRRAGQRVRILLTRLSGATGRTGRVGGTLGGVGDSDCPPIVVAFEPTAHLREPCEIASNDGARNIPVAFASFGGQGKRCLMHRV